ncbi:MAG TPA: hypothetical protein VIH90_07795 [Candidatus Saccharimonadales bacterium]
MTEASPDTAADKPVSRRHFLTSALVAIGVVGIAGGGLIEQKVSHDNQRAAAERKAEYGTARALAEQFDKGVSSDWTFVSVWPGLAVIPSSVKLFDTPSLDSSSEVDWPASHTDHHLLAQRPFLARQTARQNLFNPDVGGPANVNIGSQVLGLWMPSSNKLAYCDLGAYESSILLASSSTAPIYEHKYQGVVGEDINLEPALDKRGLVWRYLTVKEVEFTYEDGTQDTTTVNKVIGRSQWATEAESAYAYYAFNTGEGNDIVQLP